MAGEWHFCGRSVGGNSLVRTLALSPPVVVSSTQITNDGTSKRSLVTDGARLYFSEYLSGHSVLMQVSTSGGETAPVPTLLASADIYDFYPARSELLVKGAAGGTDTEWPVGILPLPAGSLQPVGNILAHAATWAPDGQHIVYAGSRVCIPATRTEAIRTRSSPYQESHSRPDFLPMAAACASPSATPTSARLPCGRFPRTDRICMQSCRTGTSPRKNLVEPGRETARTSCLNRLATTLRIFGRFATALPCFTKQVTSRHS